MITVTNTGDALLAPDGTVAASTVLEFRLVLVLDKQPTEGWDTVTGETVTTKFVTATTDEHGVFSVNLWPTSTLAPPCLYQVRSQDGLFRTFLASLPASPSSTTFQAFKASQIPLTADQLSALDEHIRSSMSLLSGTVDPTTQGVAGDYYINTATNTLYGPKTTVWPVGVKMVGTDGTDGVDGTNGVNGAPGTAGTNGTNGTDGSIWTSGTGGPSNTAGKITDWYLNDANGDIYEKTAASTWTLRDNLTGPAGTGGGTGDGDVVGPSSAVDSNFAAFDTTTGKLIKDSGSKVGDFATAGHNHTGTYDVSGAAATVAEDLSTHAGLTTTAHGGIHSVPAGGTTGQKLVKSSNTDYDTGWSTDTDAYLPLAGGTVTGAIVGGMGSGATGPKLIVKPDTNSTLAFGVYKQDGTTNILTVDTVNSRVGVLITTLLDQALVVGNSTNDNTQIKIASKSGTPPSVNMFRSGQYAAIQAASSLGYVFSIDPSAPYTDTNILAATKMLIKNAGDVGIGTTAPATRLHVVTLNTVVDAVTNVLTLDHDITGTPAAGAGTGINFLIDTTSTASQQAANIAAVWTDATTATRKGDIVLSTADSAAATEKARLTSAGAFRVGDATNNITINPATTGITLSGTATVWEDTMVPAIAMRTTGGLDMTLAVFAGGIYAYRFDLNDEVHFQVQLPHCMKVNSVIYPHLHITNKAAVAASPQNVKWEFEYTWGDINGNFSNTTTTINTGDVDLGGDAAYTHTIVPIPATGGITPATGQGGISSILFVRLKRITASANAYDTANIFFAGCDFHYEQDTLGSSSEFTK